MAKELTSLADICKEMKIAPRLARIRLRNSDELEKSEGGWNFTQAQVAKVKAIIKGSGEKPAPKAKAPTAWAKPAPKAKKSSTSKKAPKAPAPESSEHAEAT